MANPPPTVDREQLAARFDRYARLAAVGVLPIGVIAVADLITGSLTANRRIDVALLAATGMGLLSAMSTRRLAQRFRRNDFPQRRGAADERGIGDRTLKATPSGRVDLQLAELEVPVSGGRDGEPATHCLASA